MSFLCSFYTPFPFLFPSGNHENIIPRRKHGKCVFLIIRDVHVRLLRKGDKPFPTDVHERLIPNVSMHWNRVIPGSYFYS